MKARRPYSFLYVILFSLGVVFYFLCNLVSADSSVPEKIPSLKDREVRVCLKTQRFGYYEKGMLKFSGPVCTGKTGHETPKGKFRVLEKSKRRLSVKWTKIEGQKIYMYYALQFTGGIKGGHFLHEGEVLDSPSSDGCVHLDEKDAKHIFHLLQLKDAVTIE